LHFFLKNETQNKSENFTCKYANEVTL